MTKEFINYTEALALKELGFDKPCLMYYDYSWTLVESGVYECKAPLYQQAFSFFREKYGLLYNIDETYKKSSEYIYSIGYGWSDAFESYEEAEFECLKKLIEIVKEKK